MDGGTRTIPDDFTSADFALWFAIPVVALTLYFFQSFRLLGTAGCEGDCDYALIQGGQIALPWAAAACLVVSLVLVFVLRALRRRSFWAPLTGLGLVLVSATVTGSMVHAGLEPMYERNRLAEQGVIVDRQPPPAVLVDDWRVRGGTAELTLVADGTFTAEFGCGAVTGTWQDAVDDRVDLDGFDVATGCAGAYSWLAHARGASVSDDTLRIYDEGGALIGALERREAR